MVDTGIHYTGAGSVYNRLQTAVTPTATAHASCGAPRLVCGGAVSSQLGRKLSSTPAGLPVCHRSGAAPPRAPAGRTFALPKMTPIEITAE
jgi:hypothetical protein